MSSEERAEQPVVKTPPAWAWPSTTPKVWIQAGVSGLGGGAAVFLLAQLTHSFHTLLLIAPFGASCVLVFALPQSPLAQPRNVIGGHLIATAAGLAVFAWLGAGPISFGLAVGAAIAAMQLTRTLHPPAGADPIIVILSKAAWPFLFSPVLAGAVIIVIAGVAFHRGISKRAYPHGP
jgi:CBS-domain-containing membrane protein